MTGFPRLGGAGYGGGVGSLGSMLRVRTVVAAAVLALVGGACGGTTTAESARPAPAAPSVTSGDGATSTVPGAAEVPEPLRFTVAAVRARLGVVGQPSWIFLDAQGRPEKVFGSLGKDQLRRRLEALAGGTA